MGRFAHHRRTLAATQSLDVSAVAFILGTAMALVLIWRILVGA